MARKKFVKRFIKKQSEGGEPEIKQFDKSELIRIMNWYNYEPFSDKKRKSWVVDYSDNPKIKKVDERKFPSTLATICRLATRGYVLSEEYKNYIEKNVNYLVERYVDNKRLSDTIKDKPTIQERIYNQTKPVLAEIDYFVDSKLINNEEHKLNTLITDFGNPHLKHVINHIQSYIDDFSKNKKDCREVYGISTRKLNSTVKFLEELIQECKSSVQAKKKIRKIREVKKKPALEIAKRAKCSETSPIKPHKIISSSYVVIYNNKNNKLLYFVAEDSDGMSIKGTTITNFDIKKSKVLKIDKKLDLKTLPKQINKLKIYINDENNFKSTKVKITGRLNDKMDILLAI